MTEEGFSRPVRDDLFSCAEVKSSRLKPLPPKGQRSRRSQTSQHRGLDRDAAGRAWGRGGARVRGAVQANYSTLVVSFEPFPETVDEDVDVRFAPPKALIARPREPEELTLSLAEDDEPDPVIDGKIDLGALAAEFFALGLDPYPRKPGAILDEEQTGSEAAQLAIRGAGPAKQRWAVNRQYRLAIARGRRPLRGLLAGAQLSNSRSAELRQPPPVGKRGFLRCLARWSRYCRAALRRRATRSRRSDNGMAGEVRIALEA